MAAITRSSQILTVAGTSAEFTNAMKVGHKYLLISTTACWFKVGATSGTAAAAANSVYLPADTYVEIKAEGATITGEATPTLMWRYNEASGASELVAGTAGDNAIWTGAGQVAGMSILWIGATGEFADPAASRLALAQALSYEA